MRYRWFITYLFLSIIFVFYSWRVYNDDEMPSVTMNSEAYKGKVLWQKHNCIACHQLYGLGGFMGPDLTNVISNPAKGELYAAAILKHGMNRMPDYKFSDEEISFLIEFLKHTDQSGEYPLKNFKLNIDGTVSGENKY